MLYQGKWSILEKSVINLSKLGSRTHIHLRYRYLWQGCTYHHPSNGLDLLGIIESIDVWSKILPMSMAFLLLLVLSMTIYHNNGIHEIIR